MFENIDKPTPNPLIKILSLFFILGKICFFKAIGILDDTVFPVSFMS